MSKLLKVALVTFFTLIFIICGWILFDQQLSVDKESEASFTKAESCYKKFKEDYAEGSGSYIPNPASIFCECMGGGMEIIDTTKGQVGMCNINDQKIEEWEYFDQMNPYENTFSVSPLGFTKWKEYCQANTNSVYCLD